MTCDDELDGWVGAAVAYDVSDRAVTLGIRFGP